MAQKDIILDAWNYEPQTLTVVQGETDARTLCFHLMDGERAIDLTGKSVALFYHKPDGSDEFIMAEVLPETASQGIAQVLLPSQTCSVPGVIEHAELRICSTSGSNLRFPVPDILVASSAVNDDAVEGTSEFQALSALLGTVQGALDDCGDAAQEASLQAQRAEAAADSIEEVKETCEQAAEVCEQLAGELNSAIERAENAAASCEEIEENLSVQIEDAIENIKGKANGIASLDSNGKLVQMPTATDVGARASSWLPSAAEIEAVPTSEKGVADGVATLNGSGKLVQMPTAADVGARASDWLPSAEEIEAVPVSEKGEANGVATLNGSGKLVQMPTAADVGARASGWLPSAEEIEAVPISEKGATNGIATLDGSGKLVQMPTATDVGITEMHQTITADTRFNSVAVRVARIGNIVTITAPIISNYKKGEGGYPAMLTLPADYRPSTAVDILLPTTGSGDMANIMINNTSGNVTVGLLGSSDTVNLRINFSYTI